MKKHKNYLGGIMFIVITIVFVITIAKLSPRKTDVKNRKGPPYKNWAPIDKEISRYKSNFIPCAKGSSDV